MKIIKALESSIVEFTTEHSVKKVSMLIMLSSKGQLNFDNISSMLRKYGTIVNIGIDASRKNSEIIIKSRNNFLPLIISDLAW